jgi:hypothetical protein
MKHSFKINFLLLFILQFSYLFAVTPTIPKLIKPLNNARGVPNFSTKFEWESIEGEVSYRLQISTDTNFIKIIFNADSLTETDYYYNDLFTFKTKYFWRLASKDKTGTSNWSEVWSFTITGLPDAPLLEYPKNNAINVEKELAFLWSETPDALFYDIQVSTVENYAVRAIDQGGIQTGGYETINLLPKTKYFWHVNSQNTFGLGPWSVNWSFTTGDYIPSSVNNTNSNKVNLILKPNPVKNQIVLEFNLDKKCLSSFSIINEQGNSVYNSHREFELGINASIINISNFNLAKGAYLLMFKAGSTIINKKFTVE